MSKNDKITKKRGLPPRPTNLRLAEPELDDDAENANVEDADPEVKENPKSEPKIRKKATMEDHIAHYDELFTYLNNEIDRRSREKEGGQKPLRKVRKMLLKMRKEVPQVTRSKVARMLSSTRKRNAGQSGITMKNTISDELADFLDVDYGTKLSRIEATRALCVYAHLKEDEKREEMLVWSYLNEEGKRNLQNPHDKKAIIPDKKLAKLLRYPQYQKEVKAGKITTKVKDKTTGVVSSVSVSTDALYYWTIQRLITIHFMKDTNEGDLEGEE